MVREVRTPIASATPRKDQLKNVTSNRKIKRFALSPLTSLKEAFNNITAIHEEESLSVNPSQSPRDEIQIQRRTSEAFLIEDDNGNITIDCTQEEDHVNLDLSEGSGKRRESIVLIPSDNETDDEFHDAQSFIDLTQIDNDDIVSPQQNSTEDLSEDEDELILVKSVKKMVILSDDEDETDLNNDENQSPSAAHIDINIPKNSLKPKERRRSSWLNIFDIPPKTPLQRKLIDSPLNSPASIRKVLFQNSKSNQVQLTKKQQLNLSNQFYEEFNSAIFENKLPQAELEWSNNLRKTAGRAEYKPVDKSCKILLSSKVLDTRKKLRETLAHEMCHLAVWTLNGIDLPPHGTQFKYYASLFDKHYSLKNVQIEDEIKVSIKHEYEIQYKYNYICLNEDCGRIYGRHSKSIDINLKVCGLCKGKLELLDEGKKKLGSSKPNPFAEFVSQNFSKVKKEFIAEGTPFKHADIMNKLSSEWKRKQLLIN